MSCCESCEARCLPFHAEGAGVATVAAGEKASFSFSEDRCSSSAGGVSFMRPKASARSPDSLRGRGGLRPLSGGLSTWRDPSKAGRSSTILRSTSIGSERDEDSFGGATPRMRGGEAGSAADCVDASLWVLKVRFRKRSRIECMPAKRN